MDSSTWAVVVISLSFIIVFLQHFLKTQAKGKRNSEFDGPVNLPVLGSFPHILFRLGNIFKLTTCEILEELKKNWPTPTAVSLGNYNCIIIDDIAQVKKLMSSEEWANRVNDTDLFAKERAFGQDLGLLFCNGESWKEMRRNIHKTLTKFGFGRSSALELRHEEEILSFFSFLDRKLDESGGVLGMQGIFNISALNILWTMVASNRFDYESQEIHELTELLEELARAMNPREMGFLVYPWLRFIPGMTAHSTIMGNNKKLQNYFRKIIHERRELGDYKIEQNNYIDAFLLEIDSRSEVDGPNSNRFYTDEQLIMVLSDLFLTGFIPTASSLEYLIMFMVLHPEIQKKCQDEIDSLIGRDHRYPSINDTENLPYVQAVCIEVLRKVTFIPLTTRATTRDTYLDGHFVPKDTIAAINLYSIHNNPAKWDKPEEFRPERFLDENGRVANQETILPFGTGKRVCPAEVFGRLSTFAFFAYLLQRYSFENPPNCPMPDPTPNDGLGNYPKPFKALIKRR